jgi:hypothetical protein
MIANPKTANQSVASAVPSREHGSVRSHKSTQNNRRTFPKVVTVTVPAAGAVLGPAEGPLHLPGGGFVSYNAGMVSNPSLPGTSGDLVLTIYLAVSADGTGFGTLSDPLHFAVNSHLAVQQSGRQGNQFRFEGQVIRSNTPGQVGQKFAVSARVQNDLTDLDLSLNGETFSGKGLLLSFADRPVVSQSGRTE